MGEEGIARAESTSSLDGRFFRMVSFNRILSYNGLDTRTDVYRAAELGETERLASLLDAASTGTGYGKNFFFEIHDDINWQNDDGESALFTACFNGHTKCAALLIGACRSSSPRRAAGA